MKLTLKLCKPGLILNVIFSQSSLFIKLNQKIILKRYNGQISRLSFSERRDKRLSQDFSLNH